MYQNGTAQQGGFDIQECLLLGRSRWHEGKLLRPVPLVALILVESFVSY